MGQPQKEQTRLLPKALISGSLGPINLLSRLFIRLGLGPNALSLLGMAAGVGTGVLIWRGRPLWALGAGLLCGVFDLCDGQVARLTGRTSAFGAFLDSTLDRYTEFFMYAGAAAWMDRPWAYLLAGLAFLGSVGVSYTRARAEGLGLQCKSGWLQRGERLVLLALAIVIGLAVDELRTALAVVLGTIALLSNVTAVQRIIFVYRRIGKASGPASG
ncbi:MAG: CDP-alcohol phosphatidyltransferase family protein [Candidatus Aminicenantes bacterium]|nr:CDP-alcohol phosphatidyltransferase family protein [Candidatus Aminicenantes bacterium]